jgi:hypothetical protein
MSILEKLQTIDRRIVYLLLFLSVGLALIPRRPLPVIPSNQARSAFEAIENAPTDKLVIIGADWSASTRGENGAQTIAILHHLMKRRLPFAIMGFDPQGPELVAAEAEKLSKRYNYRYGTDWINWGFRPPGTINATLKAMVRGFEEGMKQDSKNTPLSDHVKLPMMARFKDIDDVSVLVVVTPSQTFESWVAFVQGIKGTPLVFCPTAVMAPEAYQYLDSGQMVGMLTGLKGALEYEGLVKEPGRATAQGLALSVSHILIILLIVVGNLGYLAQKRRQKSQQGAG